MKFNLLIRAFALKFAEERQCPAAHSQLGPVVLDTTDFMESAFVEKKAGLAPTLTNLD